MRGRQSPEVVYVERGGDSSAKWLFWGVLLGAGLAVLYAPRSGEETRRILQRKLWKIRAMAEEKLDELTQEFGGRKGSLAELEGEDEGDGGADDEGPRARPEPPRGTSSARQELERRLSDARRRRAAGDLDIEEPPA
ncbi:MAG TPA: YtxH domain-containing protein [Gemmatimonadales bacterium]|nr:YtxH domain-containing protein [Gemmatimonadales bacterium]